MYTIECHTFDKRQQKSLEYLQRDHEELRETLSPMFADEKSKYLEYFLFWYHLMTAKTIASRITTAKIPPKKARAASEELEELVDVTGQLVAGGFGMVLLAVLLVLELLVVVLG